MVDLVALRQEYDRSVNFRTLAAVTRMIIAPDYRPPNTTEQKLKETVRGLLPFVSTNAQRAIREKLAQHNHPVFD